MARAKLTKNQFPVTHGMVPSKGNEHLTVIEGAPVAFNSIKQAYAFAKAQGLSIEMFSFVQRIKKGLSWNEILKPARQKPSEESKQVAKRSRERARDEMHEICAELDRRKAEINNG